MEYMDHMCTNLESNFEKCQLEKETLSKLKKSFNYHIKPHFKGQLEGFLNNIDHNIEIQKKIEENAKEGKAGEDAAEELDAKLPVDSDQVKAVVTLVDEFNNIIAKNFSVYGQYDDFSFANSRSS